MSSFITTSFIGIFLLIGFGVIAQEEVDSIAKIEGKLLEAKHLVSEAWSLYYSEQWDEAIKAFEIAGFASFKEGDIKTVDYLLGNIPRVVAKLDKPLSYIQHLEEQVKVYKDTFGERSVALGLTYYYLSNEHNHLQQFDKALRYAETGLSIFLSIKEEIHELFFIRYYCLIGTIQLNREEIWKARAALTNSYQRLDEAVEQELIGHNEWIKESIKLYPQLGMLGLHTSEFEAALYVLERVHQNSMDDYYDSQRILPAICSNMALCYLELHRYQEAIEFSQLSIYAERATQKKDSLQSINVYTNLGRINATLKDYESAIKNYQQAHAIAQKISGLDSAYKSQIYVGLGGCYMELGNFTEAKRYKKKVLGLIDKIKFHPNLEKGAIYNFIGGLYAKQNIHPDSTLFYYQKSIAHYQLVYGEKHPKIARGLGHIQLLYLNRGNIDSTLYYTQEALKANSNLFVDSEISKNPSEDDFIDNYEGIRYLRIKIDCLAQRWNLDRDNQGLYAQILDCMELIDKVFNLELKNSGDYLVSSAVHQKEIGTIAPINRSVLYGFYQQSADSVSLRNYFYWLEKAKSQELLFAINQAEAYQYLNIAQERINPIERYNAERDSLEQALSLAIEEKDSLDIYLSLLGVRRVRKMMIGFAENSNSALRDLKYNLSQTSLNNLKEQLEENTLLVELSFDEDLQSIFYFTITNQEEKILKINLQPDLTKKITSFNKLLRSHNLLRADRRRKFINLSYELYQQFIQPIEHLLEGKERVVIIGEGVTHYLPFEALLKSNEDKPWHELDFLIKDHEISYHYSGTLFARAQEQKTDFDKELLAFAPVFADEEQILSKLREGGLQMADSTFRSIDGDHFTPLPHSEKEVKSIQALFPENAASSVLLNEAANEVNLKAALKKNHRFVHIASHSFANIDYPKFSGIACASDTISTTEDGILYVGEVYNLAVNSDLVVLSSCESGVGKLLGGEGMLGLNRSFVYAGAPNVIFSLWKVYDEMTGKLMTEFYKNALEGQSYATALRMAKLKMLQDPKTAAPDVWAAFLLVGR